MRRTTLARVYSEALAVLAVVQPYELAGRIADQREGFASSGLAGGGRRSMNATSSTERFALEPDKAAAALADLEALVRRLSAAAADLGHLQAMWMAEPRRAICGHCGDPTGSHQKTICRWCTTWLSDTGRLPSNSELAQRAAGHSVRRPKGQQ